MIELTCPCGKRFAVEDEAGGLTADCPGCGEEIDVPLVDDLAPLEIEPEQAVAEKTVAEHPLAGALLDRHTDEQAVLDAISGGRLLKEMPNAIASADVAFIRDVTRSARVLFAGRNVFMLPVLLAVDLAAAIFIYMTVVASAVFSTTVFVIAVWHMSIFLRTCRAAVAGDHGARITGFEEGPWEDMLQPVGRFIASAAVAWSPLPAYWFACRLLRRSGPPVVELVLIPLGLFFWPATILLMVTNESVNALAPQNILRVCLRAFLPYIALLLITGVIAFAGFFGVYIAVQILRDVGTGSAILMFWVCLLAFSVAGLVIMRCIGLIYHHYKARLPFDAE